MANEEHYYELVDALKRFNRKERNLLIRYALGDAENGLRLGEKFRESLLDALTVIVREDAWWATDYHINWLAAALDLYVNGEEGVGALRDNLPSPDGSQLVKGNQEDVDMVIASGIDLILIEAKAYSAWDNRQMKSKIQRLGLLREFYDRIAGPIPKPIHFHLLLASPRPPQHLDCTVWPSWTCSGAKPHWIEFPVPNSPLEVTRCYGTGNQSAFGDHWKILKRDRIL